MHARLAMLVSTVTRDILLSHVRNIWLPAVLFEVCENLGAVEAFPVMLPRAFCMLPCASRAL